MDGEKTYHPKDGAVGVDVDFDTGELVPALKV